MRRRALTPCLEPLEGRALTSSAGPTAGPGPAHLVVCEGNSLTFGLGTDDPSTQSYPAQLQARFGPGWKVFNFGIPGQATEQMLWKEPASFAVISAVAARLPNTARQRTIDVVWEGTNSIRIGDDGMAAARALARFVALRHAEHFKVIVLTCLPAQNAERVPPQFEAERRIYNALVRRNTFGADAVVDVAGDYRLADPQSAYYAPDHFHMSQAGYDVVSSLVARAVARLAALPAAALTGPSPSARISPMRGLSWSGWAASSTATTAAAPPGQ